MNAKATKPSKQTMKTLDDVMTDMSVLYDEVYGGKTELKAAAELANISGKYLKAYQLQLAREIFTAQLGRKLPSAQPGQIPDLSQ